MATDSVPDDDAQVDDEPTDDLVDVLEHETQKRLTLRSILFFLQLVPPIDVDDAVARAWSIMMVAAANRAARIFRSDMVDERPA